MTKRDRPESVPRHPMRLVTRRTGLTAARLRIWERRYGVVRPGRTGGGQRLYSDDAIARLALLARATDAGHALPQIARLSREALTTLLERDEPAPSPIAAGAPDPALADRLMGYVEQLDGAGLERALRRAALSRGATRSNGLGRYQAIGERHGAREPGS
jgi:DNA-binding transcriptional MerR regulator